MDISKSFKKDQVRIVSFRKLIQENSIYVGKKEILETSHKKYGGTLKWKCLDCGLMLTSKIQAQEHFLGKKHQNILKNKTLCNSYSNSRISIHGRFLTTKNNWIMQRRLQNSYGTSNCSLYNYGANENIQDVVPPPASRNNILETVIQSDQRNFSSTDLSIYRTPSGKYYCQSCNLTVNSQAQFLQHSESRKHKHKSKRTYKFKR